MTLADFMEMSRRSLKIPESTFTPDEISVEPTFPRCILYVVISYQIPGRLTDTVPAEKMMPVAVESEEGFGG